MSTTTKCILAISIIAVAALLAITMNAWFAGNTVLELSQRLDECEYQ